jgi:antitoxin component of MazEF toxin-antitoxin module
MKITSVQKVIKVGQSLAVTIPARDARALGITAGQDVAMSIEQISKPNNVATDYDNFVAQYGDALKSLAKK